ncbi:MAG: SDR family NAD(P)-dependent oxidoreductase [Anaerolineales bacterium]
MTLTGKLALVTGAGRGTGRALALELGRAGAMVIAVDINPDAAQRTANAINEAGGRAEAQSVDVSHKMGAQTLIYDVLERYHQIDVLVNAAEITPGASAYKMDEGEWDRTLDVNLKGTFIFSQTVARAMIAARESGPPETGGGLIAIVHRDIAVPHAAVRAAREGVRGLTVALAAEWKDFGVHVIGLSPGDRLAPYLIDHYAHSSSH